MDPFTIIGLVIGLIKTVIAIIEFVQAHPAIEQAFGINVANAKSSLNTAIYHLQDVKPPEMEAP